MKYKSKFRTTQSAYETITASQYVGNGRSLTNEEIRALYPGVKFARKMTQEEKFERVKKNMKARLRGGRK